MLQVLRAYYNDQFPADLQTFLQLFTDNFFGNIRWKNVSNDIQCIAAENRPLFIACLFIEVAIDQGLHSHAREYHQTRNPERNVPHFGVAPAHHCHPLDILCAAITRRAIVINEADYFIAISKLLIEIVQGELAGSDVISPENFLQALESSFKGYSWDDFDEIAGDSFLVVNFWKIFSKLYLGMT